VVYFVRSFVFVFHCVWLVSLRSFILCSRRRSFVIYLRLSLFRYSFLYLFSYVLRSFVLYLVH